MLLNCVMMISMFVVTTPQVDASDEPLVMIENYISNQHSLGFDHPRMLDLRKRIADATDNDFRFDLSQVQKRFETLSSDRKLLLRTRGLSHPDLIKNATLLSLMSRLLAGQSVDVLREISERRNSLGSHISKPLLST